MKYPLNRRGRSRGAKVCKGDCECKNSTLRIWQSNPLTEGIVALQPLVSPGIGRLSIMADVDPFTRLIKGWQFHIASPAAVVRTPRRVRVCWKEAREALKKLRERESF